MEGEERARLRLSLRVFASRRLGNVFVVGHARQRWDVFARRYDSPKRSTPVLRRVLSAGAVCLRTSHSQLVRFHRSTGTSPPRCHIHTREGMRRRSRHQSLCDNKALTTGRGCAQASYAPAEGCVKGCPRLGLAGCKTGRSSGSKPCPPGGSRDGSADPTLC